MRATEAHFRSLADSLGQLVWVVDEAGRLSYGNLAWQSLTQIPVGASFVESYVPALHPADRSSWEQTWERAVSSGEPYELERRVRFLPQASYVCQLEWGRPLRDNGSRTGEWVITAVDADQNARLIAPLRRRLALKDKFLALLAHEHLVELHDGKVDAYSEGPGRGSEFVVRLPCLRASAGSRGPLAKTDDSPVPM